MNWKIKAFLQKLLSKNRVGDRINHLYGSLQKSYYPRGIDYGFKELFLKLDLIDSNGRTSTFPNNAALELGTGYFLVQPVILRLLGWKRIFTVDITRDIFHKALKQQLDLLSQGNYLTKIKNQSSLRSDEIDSIVAALKESKSLRDILELLNITYLAPYEFEEVTRYGIKFDLIFSQVVLEHMPPEVLGELFVFSKEVLSANGKIVHTINFTDHFANPGFFGDKSISEFNFLKHSDKIWNQWGGNPIAYTNRLGPPYYYNLCKKSGLRVDKFIEQQYKKKKPFDVKQIHNDVMNNYSESVRREDLAQVQRGTFVIRHE